LFQSYEPLQLIKHGKLLLNPKRNTGEERRWGKHLVAGKPKRNIGEKTV